MNPTRWLHGRVPINVAALLCRIPERTLRRWAAEGRLTTHRAGRELLVDPLEVAQLQEMRDTRAGRLPPTPVR